MVDPDTLRQLREQSGLRLDKEGRFWHRGGLVEHARTLAALHQGIHRAADGRWATRIGKDWAYLDVEDAALWLRRIEPSGASLRGQLASGEWVEIDLASRGQWPTSPTVPTTFRTMCLRKAVASTASSMRDPFCRISSRRISRTVVRAGQSAARNAEKSCTPRSAGAARRMASTSSGRRISQARPRSSRHATGGPRIGYRWRLPA